MGDMHLRDIVTLLTAAGIIAGLAIAWIKWRLSDVFASKADVSGFASKGDVAGFGERLERIEAQMKGVPTHADVQHLALRISAVEANIAAVGEQIRGVRDGVGRVENDLRLLLTHELGKAKTGGGA